MRIVLLGDSHLARIRRDLPEIGADVVNAALGGATVDALDAQAAGVPVRRGDVVMVSVGTNDVAVRNRTTRRQFGAELERLLASYEVGRWVIVLPPGVVERRLHHATGRTNALLDDYRATVTAVAVTSGAQVVDPRPLLLTLGAAAFAGDGLHLSGEGYRVLLPALRAAAEAPPHSLG